MSIQRKPRVPFTQVVNDLLNDPTLSAGAKGLYAYMHSKPDGWDFSAARIANDFSNGRRGILALLEELVKTGWVVRSKQQDGRMEYELKHKPDSPECGFCNFPKCGFCTVRKAHRAESAPISNKENKETKSISNKDTVIPSKTETVQEEKPGQLPKKAGGTPLARVAKAYKRIYKSTFGIDPRVYLNGKDGAVLKSLLKEHTEYQVAAILLEYFDQRDNRLKEAAFPIAWLGTRLNQLVVAINKDIDFSDPLQVKKTVDESFKNI